MKPAADTTRVLVATDQVSEATQILRVLKDDFDHVQSSTAREEAVRDFEAYRPDVLVLAFDRLEKAQRHYLGLYRRGNVSQRHPHRTIVLCAKDQVRAAYDLCRSETFDDYVLFWPHTYDPFRLSMSIRIASRDLRASQFGDRMPARAELFTHARHLQVLETKLRDEWTEGERRLEGARLSLQQLQHDIALTSADTPTGIPLGDGPESIILHDPRTLAQMIEAFKQQQLAHTVRVEREVVQPVSQWALRMKERIEPALASTRALAHTVRQIRPIVMVVDDDEMILPLVRRTLDADCYEVVGASDSESALRQLRRVVPDVILMDLRMPGTDGVAFTRQLKALPQLQNVPVVMMTGDARRETLSDSMDAGAVEFVVKPFSRESLTSRLEKVVTNKPRPA